MGYPLKKSGDEAWETTSAERVDGGINTIDRPDRMQLSEFLRCLNVTLKKQRAYRDTGYSPFSTVVNGIPQATYQFFKKSGASELMLVTTTSVYRYNATEDQWQYVKGTASTTLTADEVAGQTDISVASIVGFSNGDKVGIILDDGTQHQTTINGVPAAGIIPILAAIPVGRTALNGATLVRAVALTGTLDNAVIVDTIASHDWFVFTNNTNPPMRYDGTDCVVIPNLPSAGNTICRSLAVYNNALFLFNTIEGGTAHPQRVRRSDSTDPTNWTTGLAGFDDLFDNSDFIMTGAVLGPYLVVYRERSIYRGEFIGQGGLNYKFEATIQGEGITSSAGVIDMGDYHIFIGNVNIYEYRAGYEFEPIGDKVYYELFGSEANVNPSMRHREFGFYVEELNEVWMFFPSIGSNFCDRLMRYNLSDESYVERRFAHKFCGFGFFQRQDSFTWNDLVGAWSVQTWQWNSRAIQANSPTTHLCHAEAGQVYEYDYLAADDSGTAISFQMETRDFVIPSGEIRLDSISGFLRGTGVLIEYSTDEGITWNSLGTVNNSSHSRFKLDRQVVTQRIRFRFSGGDPVFFISFYEFMWKLETER